MSLRTRAESSGVWAHLSDPKGYRDDLIRLTDNGVEVVYWSSIYQRLYMTLRNFYYRLIIFSKVDQSQCHAPVHSVQGSTSGSGPRGVMAFGLISP